jgi:predicted nucleotidyltransferase
MLNKENIISKIRELKPYLKDEFAVNSVGLFGSFSEELQNENSDIDLLIGLDKPIGWRIYTLEIFLEKIFNRKIDIVTKNALREPLKEAILKQVQYV